MLGFRASCAAPKPVKKPVRFPAPLQLINFVSRKGCRKNVAVSVNRLNLSEMGQTKVGGVIGKQLQQSGNDLPSMEKKKGVVDSGSLEASAEEMADRGERRFRAGTAVVASLPCHDTMSTLTFGDTTKSNGVLEGTDDSNWASSEQSQAAAPLQSVLQRPQSKAASTLHMYCGKGRTKSRNHELSVKKTPKSTKASKKMTRDVSVMTDISFGTGIISDMSIFRQSPPLHVSSHDHQYASSRNKFSNACSNEPYSTLFSNSSSSSAPLVRKGFVDKCTSPKMTFKNSALNGVNGYSLPEVVALRAGAGSVPVKHFTCGLTTETQMLSATARAGDSARRKQKRLPKKRSLCYQKQNHTTGTGKHGTRSFLVSVPRVHFDSLPLHRHLQNSKTSSLSNSTDSTCLQDVPVRTVERTKSNKNVSPKLKKHAEIERLRDGHKLLGKKAKESEMPAFSAEDVSNRPPCKSSAVPSSCSWLGSSTRKITPVSLFSSSSSSNKKAGKVPPGVASVTVVGCSPGSRKRSESSSDATGPPVKVPKILDDFPPRVTTILEENGAKEKTPTLGKNGRVAEAVHDHVHPESMAEVEVADGNDVKSQSGQPLQHLPSLIAPPEQTVADHSSVSKDVYSAELVMFDSRGECLVKDGQYSILMQNCTNGKSMFTFAPLTWSTVFGGCNSTKVKHSMRLTHSVCVWGGGVSCGYVPCYPLPSVSSVNVSL